MKSITTIYLATLGLIATISATSTGVYVCEQPKWKGVCTWTPVKAGNFGQCIPIDNKQKTINSFGTDEHLQVDIYLTAGCKEKAVLEFVPWPGYDDLTDPQYKAAAGYKTLFVKAASYQ